VLDVGCGDGRNSIFLSRLGWQVTALDSDAKALNELRYRAATAGLDIKTYLDDLRAFRSDQLFDATLANMVLHFLPEDDINQAILKLKRLTKPGGVDIIAAFTSKNASGVRPYLFKPDELRHLYADWQLISYEESLSSSVMAHGRPARYMTARLVARRPSQD
jgi:tellurite methyltransferase